MIFFIKCVKSKCQAHELLTTKEQMNARFAKQLFFNNSKLKFAVLGLIGQSFRLVTVGSFYELSVWLDN